MFRCDPALEAHLPRPVAARSALPDWLRAMAPRARSELHGQEVRTVKQCSPFVDAMAYGFVMPLPCDVLVRDGALSWHWDVPPPSVDAHPRAPVSFFAPEQVAGAPFHEPGRVVVKFTSFWTIELDPGWSLFATHPVNRTDLPFRTLTGLVDADRYSEIGILFPAIWTDRGFSGILPRGTPVAQCFAVPRALPDLAFEAFSPDHAARYEATAMSVLGTPGVYRRRYRAHRPRARPSDPEFGSQVGDVEA